MLDAAASTLTSAPTGVVSPLTVFYTLLIPALTLWYIYWRLSRKHMLELAEKLPGPPAFPLIGNILELRGSAHRKFLSIFFLLELFGDAIFVEWSGFPSIPENLAFVTTTYK